MSKILLLSTPLNDNRSGIALVEEPKALQKIWEKEKKIQIIMWYDDQFWKSAWGIIWNPSIENGTYNGRRWSVVKLPTFSGQDFSFLNAQNFPNEWSVDQRKEYINSQIEKILGYTTVNTLWLPPEREWERFWNRNAY